MWEGLLGDKKVCVKVMRVYGSNMNNQKEPMAVRDAREPLVCPNVTDTLKVFYGDTIVWKRLRHPNVIPSLGVTMSTTPLQLVLEWMPGGTLTKYVNANPRVNRAGLVRI